MAEASVQFETPNPHGKLATVALAYLLMLIGSVAGYAVAFSFIFSVSPLCLCVHHLAAFQTIDVCASLGSQIQKEILFPYLLGGRRKPLVKLREEEARLRSSASIVTSEFPTFPKTTTLQIMQIEYTLKGGLSRRSSANFNAAPLCASSPTMDFR